MSKYTAEDFANAQFAEHPNPEDVDARFAARMNTDPTYPWLLDGVPGNTDEAMARSGWVIVLTKPTISEDEAIEALDMLASDLDTTDCDNGEEWAKLAHANAKRLGLTVTDIEPSNAEKLADVYRSWYGGDKVPASLIRFMDEAGVKAPEETK